MNGSRLGRGRAGRLAVYCGCLVGLLLLVFLYRAASTEMAKLQELHTQCTQQLETSAAQFHVIFEYKTRLEKALSEEKSSNAMVKKELQQRATREKSLRDKDSVDSMNRYNSLHQSYKTLQTEFHDLQEECEHAKNQALTETQRLESTLADLRSQLNKIADEKKSVESLKTKHLELQNDFTNLKEKYDKLSSNRAGEESTNEQLRKDKIQLQRELDEIKKPQGHQLSSSPQQSKSSTKRGDESAMGNFVPPDNAQMGRPSSQQQQSSQASTSKRISKSVNIVSKVSNPEVAADIPEKAEKIQEPIKSTAEIKLPHGVVPIPKLFDLKKEEAARNSQETAHASIFKNGNPETDAKINERIHDGAVGMDNERRGGENGFEKLNNDRLKVQRGVQEIGDEPQQLDKLSNGFANAGKEVVDEQYDNDYNYKGEQQQPKNDLHLEESEDEGEDEDDQLDYPNNFKPEKRE